MRSLIILLLCGTVLFCKAETVNPVNDTRVRISIAATREMPIDSLSLFYSVSYFSSSRQLLVKRKTAKRTRNTFSFELPQGQKLCYVVLKTGGDNFEGKIILNDYIAEPGDDIQIAIKDRTLQFAGKGHKKYQVLYKIIASEQEWSKIYNDSLKNSPSKNTVINTSKGKLNGMSYPSDFKRGLVYFNSKLNFQLKILKDEKGNLSPFLYQLIQANLAGEMEKVVINTANIYSFNLNPAIPEDIKTAIRDSIYDSYQLRKLKFESLIAEPVKPYSIGYSAMTNEQSLRSKFFRRDGYNWLKGNFKGEFRDRMMVVFFSRTISNPEDLNHLKDAQTIVKAAYCLEPLQKLYLALAPNAQAFDFSLPDTTGRMISLNSLRGKCVVLDFWYTGCVNCVVLTRNMKPIIETFQSDSSVVFVSINIDKSRTTWINSVRSHLYTHSGGIDLYTDGQGYTHPLIKNYNVNAYPKLIIIDKDGRIVSSTPPRPADMASQEALIALINKSK